MRTTLEEAVYQMVTDGATDEEIVEKVKAILSEAHDFGLAS